MELSEEDQKTFESLCVAKKLVLPSRHTGKRKTGAFDDLFNKVLVDRANKDAAEIAAKLNKPKPKPPRRQSGSG